MPAQIDYYNQFGEMYKADILSCPEPHLWTTDYKEKGRIYKEIEQRVKKQEQLVDRYFENVHTVLDIGCGFGRQAYLLARKGFEVIGTDTSSVFIDIAKELFKSNGYRGEFHCIDILSASLSGTYKQVLLLDVLEHISPKKRRFFLQQLHALIMPGGKLVMSLPHVKKKFTSQLNNGIRKALTQHLAYFRNQEEHPYPIPQKSQVLLLTRSLFRTIDFKQSPDSDYYVLERL